AEGAEFAMGHADVGGINVPVDVEVADVAVALFADVVREPAQGEQIGRAVKGDAVFEAEPFAGENFGGDGFEARIVDYGSRGFHFGMLGYAHGATGCVQFRSAANSTL